MSKLLAIYTLDVAKLINKDIKAINYRFLGSNKTKKQIVNLNDVENNIYLALQVVSESLANSYFQIKTDISTPERLSWAGTAHEIRQLLSTLLETLAPENEVIKQNWYKQDQQTKGPTQKQRTHYILLKNNLGSKEQEVAENVENIDAWIETLVRASYSRASDAAHRFKNFKEVVRILRYFEAFAQDLLDLS